MVTKLKQYNPKASDIVNDWQVVDADGQVLGRLASQVAMYLMGKHKPTYVPHMLTGDFVVVINASKIKVTGAKAEQKIYKRHSQYPGNLKEIPYARMQERQPTRIIELAVRGMLPKSKLGRQMMTRLKIYAGVEHPHAAQILGSERRPAREEAAAVKAQAAAVTAKPAAKKASVPKAEAAAVATEAVETAEASPKRLLPRRLLPRRQLPPRSLPLKSRLLRRRQLLRNLRLKSQQQKNQPLRNLATRERNS